MNRDPIPAESFSKRAGGFRDRPICSRLKGGRQVVSDPFNFSEVFNLIGRYPNRASWRQSAMERGKEAFGHDSAGSMATLRPRVRKHQVKDGHRTRGHEVTNRVGNFAPQEARVFQPTRRDLLAGTPNPSNQTLDSKVIPQRISRGRGRQKQTIAAAQIDLERGGVTVDRRKLQGREIVSRNNFRGTHGRGQLGGVQHLIVE
jgi:hypothetical protein